VRRDPRSAKGSRSSPDNQAATTAPDKQILTDVANSDCGRCEGPAGPDGAWCDQCIGTCREHTERTDLQRLPELNSESKPWAAYFYARARVPVFPLLSGKKAPATKNGFKDASTDLQLIRDHWQRHPNHNIGIATGHQFDVLDVDTKDGRPGYESLTRLRIAGLTVGVWAAATTPSGGRHILFAPSGDGNHSDGASGLDFRGLGGYIVGPPSHTVEILKPNGQIDQHEGTYQWEFADPDARARPFNWAAAMEHIHGPAPRPEHRIRFGDGDIAGLVAFVAEATPESHQRNTRLYWAACRAHEQGLPTDELFAAAVAQRLPASEAKNTIASAHNAPPRRPT
jgi:Bifunctional DNA primase/polymerase, N-terminal